MQRRVILPLLLLGVLIVLDLAAFGLIAFDFQRSRGWNFQYPALGALFTSQISLGTAWLILGQKLLPLRVVVFVAFLSAWLGIMYALDVGRPGQLIYLGLVLTIALLPLRRNGIVLVHEAEQSTPAKSPTFRLWHIFIVLAVAAVLFAWVRSVGMEAARRWRFPPVDAITFIACGWAVLGWGRAWQRWVVWAVVVAAALALITVPYIPSVTLPMRLRFAWAWMFLVPIDLAMFFVLRFAGYRLDRTSASVANL